MAKNTVTLDDFYTLAGKVYEPGEQTVENEDIAKQLNSAMERKKGIEAQAKKEDEERIAATQAKVETGGVSVSGGTGLDVDTVQEMIKQGIANARAEWEAEAATKNSNPEAKTVDPNADPAKKDEDKVTGK